ncbi:MAG: acyl-CoA dehydrogenase family protein [Polyangiaceae bacterium]
MVAFSPSEDETMMRDEVVSFAKTLRAECRAFEKARAVSEETRKTAHGMGLGSLAIPASCGGAGLGLVTQAIMEEAIAYGDPAAPFGLAGGASFVRAVLELGSEEDAMKILSRLTAEDGFKRFGAVAWGERKANPERPGFSTIASGGKVSGEKSFVMNANRAETFVVFAQVDETKGWDGIGAFVVDADAPGVTVSARHTTLGLDIADVADVKFENAPATKLGDGSAIADKTIRFFVKAALVMAARAVGLAQAAFDVTREYCDGRKAFGKPIGHFQAVAFNLADRAMDVDAARSLVWRAAEAWDRGSPKKEALLYSAHAVSFAFEAAMRCGDDAVQLHGGSGFMRDYPVEKFMRDAKQLQLCVMTAEQADQLAAAIEVGQPLSIGAILPTPETQTTLV